MVEEHETALARQREVFEHSMDIYNRRRRFRGDAWLNVDDPVVDLIHHIESKTERVKAICKSMLRVDLTSDEVSYALVEALDDLRDLLNYGAFLHRWLMGERRK